MRLFVILDDFQRQFAVHRERAVFFVEIQRIPLRIGNRSVQSLLDVRFGNGKPRVLFAIRNRIHVLRIFIFIRQLGERGLIVNGYAASDDRAFIDAALSRVLVNDEQTAAKITFLVCYQLTRIIIAVRVFFVNSADDDERRTRSRSRDNRRVGRSRTDAGRTPRSENAAVVRRSENGFGGCRSVRDGIPRSKKRLEIADDLIFRNDERAGGRRREKAFLDRRIDFFMLIVVRICPCHGLIRFVERDRATLHRPAVRGFSGIIRSRDVHGLRAFDRR